MMRLWSVAGRVACIAVFFVCLISVVAANCQDEVLEEEGKLVMYDPSGAAMMHALHEEWSTVDGIGVFYLVDKCFWALLLDPDQFYEEFSSDSACYYYFSENIDNNVFCNFNDTTTTHLERLRKASIDRLIDETYAVRPGYLGLHEEMIARLGCIEVSYVD